MKLVLLDGSTRGDVLASALVQEVLPDFERRGISADCFHLVDMDIAFCLGDFKCWTRTPGVCALDDENRVIAQAVAVCDFLLYLTPVTFGGYSSELKKAVDHLIQVISPFFMKYHGETHHELRYKKSPQLIAVGILPSPDNEAEEIFSFLVERNALNLHTRGKALFAYRLQGTTQIEMLMEEMRRWTQ